MTAFAQDQMDAMYDEAERLKLDIATVNLPQLAAQMSAAEKAKPGTHPAFSASRVDPAPAPGGSAPAVGLNLPPARGEATVEPKVAVPPASQQPPRDDAHLPAPRETHLPGAAAPMTGLEGLEGLSASDMKVPTFKIRQNVSGSSEAENVPLGHLFISSDPDGALPERKVRFLDVTPARSLMVPYRKPKEAAILRDKIQRERGIEVPNDVVAICSSNDRITPSPRPYGTIAKTCAECPYTKWQTIGGERVPPECGEVYLMLLLDEETSMPALYRAKGKAIAPAKNLNTNLMMIGKRTNVPPAGFVVTMGSKEVGEKDKSFVPTFSRPERPTFGNPPRAGTVEELAEDLASTLAVRRSLVAKTLVIDERGEPDA
jgi:hypothetical protein